MSMKMKNYGNEEYREPVILKKASIKCHDNEHEILRLEDFNLVVEKGDGLSKYKVRPIMPCKVGIENEDGIIYKEYTTESCFLNDNYYMKLPKTGRIIKFKIRYITDGKSLFYESTRLFDYESCIVLTQYPKSFKEIEDFDLKKNEKSSMFPYDERVFLRELGITCFENNEDVEDRPYYFTFHIDWILKYSKDEYFNRIKNDNERLILV